MAYKEVFQWLTDLGLLDVILPFILVFTITFALLQRSQIFGKDGRKISAMIAFVFGFIAVLAANILTIVNTVLFYFVLLLVVLLALALIIGLAGGHLRSRLYVSLVIVLGAIFAFGTLVKLGFIDTDEFFATPLWPMLFLAAVGGLLYYFLRGKKTGGQPTPGPTPPGPQPVPPVPPVPPTPPGPYGPPPRRP